MELLPTVDALHWCAEHGAEILGDERVSNPQVFLKQKRPLLLRAARRGRGDRALELPLVDPVRRGRDRADGRQRGGAQARLADAADRRADPPRSSSGRAARGARPHRARRRRGGRRACRVQRGKIFFTGSVEVGRGVGMACAERLKGSVLELGGKDPQLVLADANLAHRRLRRLWGGFANAGQTCSGIERVYVDARGGRQLHRRRGARRRAPCGSATRSIGTPSRADGVEDQFELVRELVDDAVRRARQAACGGPDRGARPERPFYRPAVLTGVTHDMRIMREEIFGPVLPIVTVAPRTRRSSSPTTPSSAWAPRCGRSTASGRADRARQSSRAWSG